MDTTVQIETEFVVLAALLKLAAVVGSGGEAKMLIREGLVRVNGAVEERRGAKIRPGDVVSIDADPAVRITVAGAEGAGGGGTTA